MAELRARDSKLVQYLNEAYGKEKELETALQAHIGMTTRGSYKKRLQQHLTETKGHARKLESRIKNVGGTPQAGPVEGTDALAKGASAAVEIGSRAVAVAKAPLHVLRGTGEQEKMLKNAKTQYADEHEEIATYTAIEALAEILRDSETARLARSIRREEERMAKFLERLIPTLTKAVTQAEIPASQRRSPSSRRRSKASSRRGSRRNGASSRSSGARARASATSSRSSAKASRGGEKASRSAGSKARGRGTSRGTTSSRSGTSSSRSARRGTSPRSAAGRATTAAKPARAAVGV
jgi:ferritin-like metal-binding protein YciE